ATLVVGCHRPGAAAESGVNRGGAGNAHRAGATASRVKQLASKYQCPCWRDGATDKPGRLRLPGKSDSRHFADRGTVLRIRRPRYLFAATVRLEGNPKYPLGQRSNQGLATLL